MPSCKENTPPALNNLIIELLGLKLYKEAHQLVNNRLSAMLLGTQLLLNQSYMAFVATTDKK
jgi:hypothetical protein